MISVIFVGTHSGLYWAGLLGSQLVCYPVEGGLRPAATHVQGSAAASEEEERPLGLLADQAEPQRRNDHLLRAETRTNIRMNETHSTESVLDFTFTVTLIPGGWRLRSWLYCE